MQAIWAIEENSFRAVLSQAVLAAKSGLPVAGPVDDAKRAGMPIQKHGTTAVISLMGPMMKRPNFIARLFFGATGSEDVRRAVESAAADDEIEQIILRIDSPGGTVDGTAELGDAVKRAAQGKLVIAQVDGMAASAAYWVASQATKIHAGRNDLVGSIGTRMMLYDFSEMFSKEGIEAIALDTGQFKSTGAQGTEVTQEQRDYLQGLVNALQVDFSAAVMSGRGMDQDSFDAVSDGRTFVASEALSLGLVDKISTMDETMSIFRKQAARRARLARTQSA